MPDIKPKIPKSLTPWLKVPCGSYNCQTETEKSGKSAIFKVLKNLSHGMIFVHLMHTKNKKKYNLLILEMWTVEKQVKYTYWNQLGDQWTDHIIGNTWDLSDIPLCQSIVQVHFMVGPVHKSRIIQDRCKNSWPPSALPNWLM